MTGPVYRDVLGMRRAGECPHELLLQGGIVSLTTVEEKSVTV